MPARRRGTFEPTSMLERRRLRIVAIVPYGNGDKGLLIWLFAVEGVVGVRVALAG